MKWERVVSRERERESMDFLQKERLFSEIGAPPLKPCIHGRDSVSATIFYFILPLLNFFFICFAQFFIYYFLFGLFLLGYGEN